MSVVGILFPGQGAQYVGMARSLYDASPEVRAMYDEACQTLGYDITSICFEGPAEALTQTRVCQPAIFLHSMAVWKLVKARGIVPRMAAGHSLGEYSALGAAEAVNFADGLQLVKTRGELVQQAAEAHPGTMAAVIGLEDAAVYTVCDDVRGGGVLQPANFNALSQVVISGDRALVHRAMETAKERGAKKVVELQVSGAFHSPHMESARAGMAAAFDCVNLRDPVFPVIANASARPLTTAAEIRRYTVEQTVSPVRWHESMAAMIAGGCDTFIEMGPGKVLQGLLKRIDRNLPCLSVDTQEDLEQLEKFLI